jgi:metal-responsive CopG/Arc/MetJ family transcriptional regulator
VRLYRVILSGVKTAISIPDDTYERAAKRAKDLGMSRSEFFSRAAARYLDQLDNESLTHQINAALEALGDSDDTGADAVVVGRGVLSDVSDDW